MVSLVDLTSVPALDSFPWESTYQGLAEAHKSVTTFYGDVHSTRFQHTAQGFSDRNAWRWYNALKHGVQVEGFNVNLTGFIGDWWWARMHEPDLWKPTLNHKLFANLHEWIEKSQIFTHTGRIVFFVQLTGQGSPIHTDFDPQKVPAHLRAPTEFLWMTPPDNPKDLTVDGVSAPWACWFDHFQPHGSKAADKPQWSLRIDGVFTDTFRQTFMP